MCYFRATLRDLIGPRFESYLERFDLIGIKEFRRKGSPNSTIEYMYNRIAPSILTRKEEMNSQYTRPVIDVMLASLSYNTFLCM